MKTLLAHHIVTLERLTEELYKLYDSPCFTSAIALARGMLFEIAFLMSQAQLEDEKYRDFIRKINRIQTDLDMLARGRCKGISLSRNS